MLTTYMAKECIFELRYALKSIFMAKECISLSIIYHCKQVPININPNQSKINLHQIKHCDASINNALDNSEWISLATNLTI